MEPDRASTAHPPTWRVCDRESSNGGEDAVVYSASSCLSESHDVMCASAPYRVSGFLCLRRTQVLQIPVLPISTSLSSFSLHLKAHWIVQAAWGSAGL